VGAAEVSCGGASRRAAGIKTFHGNGTIILAGTGVSFGEVAEAGTETLIGGADERSGAAGATSLAGIAGGSLRERAGAIGKADGRSAISGNRNLSLAEILAGVGTGVPIAAAGAKI
jgi:hypothetical protein